MCGTVLVLGTIIIVVFLTLRSKSKPKSDQEQQQTAEGQVLCAPDGPHEVLDDPDGPLELDEDIFLAEQGCERLVPTMINRYEAMATGADCRPDTDGPDDEQGTITYIDS